MSGPRTTLSVDIHDAEAGVAAMERRAHNLEPAFSEIKEAMKLDQREHRDATAGPDGQWAARAESTKEHHKKLPRRVLGKLATAISYQVLPYAAIATSRIPWSSAQQEGETVGHGARLPSRVFMWISDKLAQFSEDAISARVVAAWSTR